MALSLSSSRKVSKAGEIVKTRGDGMYPTSITGRGARRAGGSLEPDVKLDEARIVADRGGFDIEAVLGPDFNEGAGKNFKPRGDPFHLVSRCSARRVEDLPFGGEPEPL